MDKGTLYIIGIGPGNKSLITPAAKKALEESDVIVGYTLYTELIKELISHKEIISTGMTREIDRCGKAIDMAMEGKRVAIVCSGDPGIYAMAGLTLEMSEKRVSGASNSFDKNNKTGSESKLPFEIKIIPGVPALAACAAALGAPLMHDFASISLSDRLTPWDIIEKRIKATAESDFVIVIYNPRSKGREGHLKKTCQIISQYRQGTTPAGIVKAATREDEQVLITTLNTIPYNQVDMQTTVIIGNSNTYKWGDMLITPRGYKNKYTL